MNTAILTGRLTKEPETRYTQNGKAVTQFTIAINRYSKDKESNEADFIPIVVWGKSAEYCANNLQKGDKVLVNGRIQTRNFDGKDGKKVYITEVVALIVEAFGKKEHKETTPESFGSEIDMNDEPPF